MNVLFLVLLGFSGEMFIDNTEIFFPLSQRFVCMDSEGRLFVADVEESQVVCFNQKGKESFRFGAKGKGPGEFETMAQVYIIKDQLIVGSRAHQSIFDLDGKFIRRVRTIKREMKKTANGWIGHDNFGDQPVSLVWYSEDLTENKEIAVLPVKYPGKNLKPPNFSYSSVINIPKIQVSQDGTLAFIKSFDDFAIHVYDTNTLKEVRVITRSWTRQPFDHDWGKENYANFLKELEGKVPPGALKFLRTDPEYFPALNRLFVVDGSLVVEAWTKNPKQFALFTYEFNGKEKEPLIRRSADLGRVLAVRDGYAYISLFPDEEAAIVRVPIKDVDTYLKENPFTFDYDKWAFGR